VSGIAPAVGGSDTADVALGDVVYAWVRGRIIDGTLPPGSRIRERELAQELNVSRIPIREAFPRLEAEGYIYSLHRRGVIVAPMSVREISELFDVRSSLEVLAARLAATECARGASPDRLHASLARAETAVAAEDGQETAEATGQFHEEIDLLSGNELLQRLMVPVHGRTERLFHLVTQRDDRVVHAEHREICSAIVNGEVERAGALSLAHVEHSRYETMPIVERMLRG
jgi:DNA-binding GntR family transcriptional regulator